MRLKHLLPFDRFVLEGPISAREAALRLKAGTAYIYNAGQIATPHPLEGRVWTTGFDLATWPERARPDLSPRERQDRNMARLICRGRILDREGGCRLEVTVRPRLFVLAVLAIFVVSDLGQVVAWCLGLPPGLKFPLSLIPWLMTALLYITLTLQFWKVRDRAVSTLVQVLRGSTEG